MKSKHSVNRFNYLKQAVGGKRVLGGVYKIDRLTIEAGVWKMPETKLAMYFKRRQLHTLVAQNSKRLLIEHWKFAIQDLLENKGDGK